jgi:tRNA(adenine34) deaminase
MIVFDDAYYMRRALNEALQAAEEGEVPVGAVAVHDGKIIARAWNQVEKLKDATAHAEIIALTQASAMLGDWRLEEVDLYVTKEPCAMCAGALVNCRLRRLIFGMADPRCGGAGSALNITGFPGMLHQVQVTSGVLEDECKELMQEFFKKVRQRPKKKI